MSLAQKVYLTRIHQHFEGDVFFPELNASDWQLTSNIDCKADEKNPFDYSFQVWERKPGSLRQGL